MNRVGIMAADVLSTGQGAGSQSAIADAEISGLTRGMVAAKEEAFLAFSKLYSSRIYRYLLVLTHGDEALAVELTQQTMIKAARNAKVFETELALWNWLALLARNCAIDEQRKRSRHWSMLVRFWEKREVPMGVPSEVPAESLYSKLLGKELGLLEEEERHLLEGKYMEGLSVRELAAVHGMSEKAVESRLSRLRIKLRNGVLSRMKYEQA